MATASPIEENWQTSKKTIRERNKFMFNNPLLSDVEILTSGAADAEGKHRMNETTIPAHKYVLAIGSPVFFAMFYGEMAETRNIIELPDCDFESFMELLRYLYYDEVKLTGSNVMQVLYLARKYDVPSLAAECSVFLQTNLSPDNVFSVLPSAVKFQDKKLANKCWEIIDHEGSEAVKSEPFKCIDKTLLVSVLEKSTINCPEVHLFNAMMAWASNECKRRGRADTGKEKRDILGEDVFHLCRFPLIELADFAETVLDADVLNPVEVVQMFKYFGQVSIDNMCFSTETRVDHIERILYVRRFDPYGLLCGLNIKQKLSDIFWFSVDQRIKVHGVTLVGNKGATYEVEFCFKEKNSTTNLFYKKDLFVPLKLEEKGCCGYDVMFDEPIQLSANQKYTFEAHVRVDYPDHVYLMNKTVANFTKRCEGVTFTFVNGQSLGSLYTSEMYIYRIIFKKTVIL